MGLYSTASASYIFDIYDNSSTDIGTFGFNTLTGTNTLTGIFQADLSVGGVAFTLSDLLPSTWTITGVSNEVLNGAFRWGSPTYGDSSPSNTGWDVEFRQDPQIDNALNYAAFVINCGTSTACVNEYESVETAWSDQNPFNTVKMDIPEPTTIALLGLSLIGLVGLKFAREKKKSDKTKKNKN